jgi:hypothetical protein
MENAMWAPQWRHRPPMPDTILPRRCNVAPLRRVR